MIRGKVRGTEVIVTGLQNTSNAVMKAAFMGVVDALQLAYGHAHDIISESDHSLKDLAAMGHPYGMQHPQVIHDPDEAVHKQSGDYLDALKVEKPQSYADRDIIGGKVHIDGDEDMQQLDRFIQLGTERMRARSWAERVVADHGEEYAAAVESRVTAAVSSERSS